MSREKDLAKNTIIITIGNICTKLITFFLLPLYTGILSTAEYGTVDLLNTLVSLLLPIITFQIEQAIFRELIEKRKDMQGMKEIISTGIITVAIQCIIFFILFLAVAPFIKNEYKTYLVVNVIVHIIMSLLLQIARGVGDNKQYAIASFLSATSTILFNVLFLVVYKFRVEGMLIGTFLGQVVGIIYTFFSLKLFRYITIKKFDKKIVIKLLKYSIPLIPNAIAWWVFNSSDRFIVSLVLGLSSTGLLSVSYKFSNIYIMLYNMFNMSWTESISLNINDKDIQEYFNKMFNIVLKFFTSMGIGLISVIPVVWPIMINSKFIGGYGLVPILVIATIFNVIVGLISVIYVAKKNTKAIASTSIVSAIINIVVHLVLIKFVGLYAAAISTFVSFFVMSIYRIYDINKRYFKINIDKKFALESLIITFIITTIYYINNKYAVIVGIMISILYAYFSNKNSINSILNIVKKKENKNETI